MPPGRVNVHQGETGFFREVYDTEEGVLGALRRVMAGMPAYSPDFFRVAEPAEPRFPSGEIERIVPFNQRMTYEIDQVLARLVDGSEHLPFRPEYGPEIYCGLVQGCRVPLRDHRATGRASWAGIIRTIPGANTWAWGGSFTGRV